MFEEKVTKEGVLGRDSRPIGGGDGSLSHSPVGDIWRGECFFHGVQTDRGLPWGDSNRTYDILGGIRPG